MIRVEIRLNVVLLKAQHLDATLLAVSHLHQHQQLAALQMVIAVDLIQNVLVLYLQSLQNLDHFQRLGPPYSIAAALQLVTVVVEVSWQIAAILNVIYVLMAPAAELILSHVGQILIVAMV